MKGFGYINTNHDLYSSSKEHWYCGVQRRNPQWSSQLVKLST